MSAHHALDAERLAVQAPLRCELLDDLVQSCEHTPGEARRRKSETYRLELGVACGLRTCACVKADRAEEVVGAEAEGECECEVGERV